MSLWGALIVAAVGCYLIKLAGLSLPASVLGHPRVQRIAALLPPAMLAALVAVDLFENEGAYHADPAVLVGVGAAVVALLLEQGLVVVFAVAIAVTAAVRLLT